MPMVAIDTVIVDRKLWTKVVAGDKDAKTAVRNQLDGLVTYCHSLRMPAGDWMTVPLQELEQHGIIKSITLHKENIA